MTTLFAQPSVLRVIACFLLTSGALYAQQNAITLTPLEPLIGKFSFGYERALGKKTGLLLEYQRWFEKDKNEEDLVIHGFPATINEKTTNTGYRIHFLLRQYIGSVMQGGFLEAGAFMGRHNIILTSETTVWNNDPGIPFGILQRQFAQVEYEGIKAYGVRLGGGWRTVKGNFCLDFSGGINLDGSPQDIRPGWSMKTIAPYLRLALGLSF